MGCLINPWSIPGRKVMPSVGLREKLFEYVDHSAAQNTVAHKIIFGVFVIVPPTVSRKSMFGCVWTIHARSACCCPKPCVREISQHSKAWWITPCPPLVPPAFHFPWKTNSVIKGGGGTGSQDYRASRALRVTIVKHDRLNYAYWGGGI